MWIVLIGFSSQSHFGPLDFAFVRCLAQRALLLSAAALACLVAWPSAAPAGPPSRFTITGAVGEFTDITKVSAGGAFSVAVGLDDGDKPSDRNAVLVGLQRNGSLDKSWGAGGYLSFPCAFEQARIAPGPSGDVYVICADQLRHVLPDGSIDSGFSGDGITEISLPDDGPREIGFQSSTAKDVDIGPGGAVYVLGESYESGGGRSSVGGFLARYDSSGALDPTFATDGIRRPLRQGGNGDRARQWRIENSEGSVNVATASCDHTCTLGAVVADSLADQGEGTAAAFPSPFSPRYAAPVFSDLDVQGNQPTYLAVAGPRDNRVRLLATVDGLTREFKLGDVAARAALAESGSADHIVVTSNATSIRVLALTSALRPRLYDAAATPEDWQDVSVTDSIQTGRRLIVAGTTATPTGERGFTASFEIRPQVDVTEVKVPATFEGVKRNGIGVRVASTALAIVKAEIRVSRATAKALGLPRRIIAQGRRRLSANGTKVIRAHLGRQAIQAFKRNPGLTIDFTAKAFTRGSQDRSRQAVRVATPTR